MVDDLEERLTRYRVDLDDAVTADLARRHLACRDAGSHDADPFPPDTDHWIRLEPAMSASVGRRRVKSVVVATLGVAAAVVAIVLVATRDDDAVNPADEPSPTVTVTVPPAPPPQALPATPGEPFIPINEIPTLEPGTYFVDEIDGTPTPRIYFTIGAGWKSIFSSPSITNFTQSGVRYSSGGFIGFRRGSPSAVYSDACHWSDGYYPGPVDTVDGFVAALSEQRGWADVTAPSDISIDGYAGKALQRTAPADISDCNASEYGPRLGSGGGTYPAFQSWEDTLYEPGSIETLWVLDIDGTVVVISAALLPSDATVTVAAEGPSAADRAEFAAVLDSIRIDRG